MEDSTDRYTRRRKRSRVFKLSRNEPEVEMGQVLLNARVITRRDKHRVPPSEHTYPVGMESDSSVLEGDLLISTPLWKTMASTSRSNAKLLGPGLAVTSCFNGLPMDTDWSFEGIANSNFEYYASTGQDPSVSVTVGGSTTCINTGPYTIRPGFMVVAEAPKYTSDHDMRIKTVRRGVSTTKLIPTTMEMNREMHVARLNHNVLSISEDISDIVNNFPSDDIALITTAISIRIWDVENPRGVQQIYERVWEAHAGKSSVQTKYEVASALHMALQRQYMDNYRVAAQLLNIHHEIVELNKHEWSKDFHKNIVGKCIEKSESGKNLRVLMSSAVPHRELV